MNKNVEIKILNKLTFYSRYMKHQGMGASTMRSASSLENLDQHASRKKKGEWGREGMRGGESVGCPILCTKRSQRPLRDWFVAFYS